MAFHPFRCLMRDTAGCLSLGTGAASLGAPMQTSAGEVGKGEAPSYPRAAPFSSSLSYSARTSSSSPHTSCSRGSVPVPSASISLLRWRRCSISSSSRLCVRALQVGQRNLSTGAPAPLTESASKWLPPRTTHMPFPQASLSYWYLHPRHQYLSSSCQLPGDGGGGGQGKNTEVLTTHPKEKLREAPRSGTGPVHHPCHSERTLTMRLAAYLSCAL